MDGTSVKNGNDGKFVNNSGSNDGFDHTELQNGTTYYYSAFTYDETGNYSETAHISATPCANIYTKIFGDISVRTFLRHVRILTSTLVKQQ